MTLYANLPSVNMRSVDLNCDMGESFGPWQMGRDADLMRYVSSVNIACGFHAGDAMTMRKTVELAIEHNVAIGAHPGYPDLQGFGRRNMSVSLSDLHDIVLYQVAALKGICEAYGTRLGHVKPHGAMYNQAARDSEMSRVIANAVRRIDPTLILFGLSGSRLVDEAGSMGLRTASEAFADRTYRPDGTLTPRTEPGAMITDAETAAQQALAIVTNGYVVADDGTSVPVKADTICIHGDAGHALEFAAAIFETLKHNGVEMKSLS